MATTDPIPRWLLAVLAAAACVVLAPFAPWVIIGVWFGLAARRVHVPLAKRLGGRDRLSATLTVLLMMSLLIPVAAVVTSLVFDAIALVQQLLQSDRGQEVLERLVSSDPSSASHAQASTWARISDVVVSQGDRAWAIVKQVAGAAAHVVIGMLIMVSGMYGVLVEGRDWYAWIEKHAPMPASSVQRFADAFRETGRGVAYGIVGAGLIQSIVATIVYLVLGVPSALALGLLTLVFSVIPAVGTAIVWAPVAAGLALTGRMGAAIALAVIGVTVIGTVDNIARPYLAKRGKLQLPTYVVLVAMFGGLSIFGGWGIILGPLLVRLAKEALVIRAAGA
jgi:predicted PurR-regulated permease PerM